MTQGLSPLPILQHQGTGLDVMLETGTSRLLPGLGPSMCCSSVGYWETLGGAALPLHTAVWDWFLSLFTMPILFSSQSKCLAQGPVLPGRADAKFRAQLPTQEIPYQGSFT